jgi:hypothetical protein
MLHCVFSHPVSGADDFESQVMCTDLAACSRWSMDKLYKLPNVKGLHAGFRLGGLDAGAVLPPGRLRA